MPLLFGSLGFKWFPFIILSTIICLLLPYRSFVAPSHVYLVVWLGGVGIEVPLAPSAGPHTWLGAPHFLGSLSSLSSLPPCIRVLAFPYSSSDRPFFDPGGVRARGGTFGFNSYYFLFHIPLPPLVFSLAPASVRGGLPCIHLH